MSVSRRHFLGLTAGSALAFGLSGCGIFDEHQTGHVLKSAAGAPIPEPFSVPLPIPPTAEPVHSSGGSDLYHLVQREAKIQILPGSRTPILGYDGRFPGPTIESRSGHRTVVRHTNHLEIPTVVHLHGGHTPPADDGFPTDLVLPNGMRPPKEPTDAYGAAGTTHGSRAYAYPMHQRAATLWYHDHRMDFTGQSVYRGLAGFHLVRDDEEDALPLPGGDREIPLMIVDRAFEEDGAFRYPALDPTMLHTPGVTSRYMAGVLGDVVLVNGAPWPELEVDAARYRFRILNASNARRYDLRLDPPPSRGAPFVQVGSDGGLLQSPIDQSHLLVAPAERFDVVVDFSQYDIGSLVTMTNAISEGMPPHVMRFRVARKASDDSHVPHRLSTIEPAETSAAVRTRRFDFTRGELPNGEQGWLINGRAYDPARIDARPALGDVELWQFTSDAHHPIHVHLGSFQVTRRGGTGKGPFDHGWKDTVDVRPGEVVEIAERFTDHAGKYVFHCHNLEHEDMMMMANFETART